MELCIDVEELRRELKRVVELGRLVFEDREIAVYLIARRKSTGW